MNERKGMNIMSNDLQIIDQREVLGKEFRIYGDFQNPLFLAKDVAEWIDYSKTGEGYYNVSAMLASVDNNEKLTINILNSETGKANNKSFLTEDGLYEVLMQSRKPIAKKFKAEVKKILKDIRTTGGYIGNDDLFVNTYLPFADESIQQLFKLNLMTIRQLNEKIEYMEPLAEFAETVANSADTIDIGQLAKLAYDEHINIGRNRLFEWMRGEGYLRKNNEPYQEFVNKGWFKLVEQPYSTPYGDKLNVKTLVTGKGQVAIIEKLRKNFI